MVVESSRATTTFSGGDGTGMGRGWVDKWCSLNIPAQLHMAGDFTGILSTVLNKICVHGYHLGHSLHNICSSVGQLTTTTVTVIIMHKTLISDAIIVNAWREPTFSPVASCHLTVHLHDILFTLSLWMYTCPWVGNDKQVVCKITGCHGFANIYHTCSCHGLYVVLPVQPNTVRVVMYTSMMFVCTIQHYNTQEKNQLNYKREFQIGF